MRYHFSSDEWFISSIHASDSLSKSPENWMSKLDDGKHLTEINIPGSHDSGSFTLTDPVKISFGQRLKIKITLPK